VSIFDRLTAYFGRLYSPAIAAKCLRPLLYSGILQKWVHLEERNHFRYRLNVMLKWRHGWFKSSVLKQVAGWMPCNARALTASSSAAIRGSFRAGQFYVPELLLNDILIFPELTSVLRADDEVVAALLGALEEADVRVALVKAMDLTQEEERRLETYGARFEDQRLCYRNRATVWTATHTVDNIDDRLRDSLLSRFHVCTVRESEIPREAAWRDPSRLYDADLEQDVYQWLTGVFLRDSTPDHAFAAEVVARLQERFADVRKPPREVGDARRMALAHHELFPDHDAQATADVVAPFLEAEHALTTREIIANFIFQQPRTAKEIIRHANTSKSNVYNHMKRLGVSKVGHNPTRYYLDSIPEGDA
jgi:hypothetical protein